MASALWPGLTELVRGTQQQCYHVGSPAVSGDDAGSDGITAFLNQVEAQELRVDSFTMHRYGWTWLRARPAASRNQVGVMEALPKSTDLVTEFSGLNLNPDDPQANAVKRLVVFAAHPRIERYADFPWAARGT